MLWFACGRTSTFNALPILRPILHPSSLHTPHPSSYPPSSNDPFWILMPQQPTRFFFSLLRSYSSGTPFIFLPSATLAYPILCMCAVSVHLESILFLSSVFLARVLYEFFSGVFESAFYASSCCQQRSSFFLLKSAGAAWPVTATPLD